MKNIILLLFLVSLQNIVAQNNRFQEWVQYAKDQANLQPKYGLIERTNQQLESDSTFIAEMLVESNGDYQAASKKMTAVGFRYLYERGDLETAMKRFNQGYLLDQNNADIYYGYGVVYFNLGGMSQAREQFDEGLLLNPDHSEMLTDYATTYLGDFYENYQTNEKKAQESLEEALKFLQKSAKIDPAYSSTIYKLSIVHMYLGNCKKAKKYLESAKEMGDPNVTVGYENELNQTCN